jgi:hypothetical protein
MPKDKYDWADDDSLSADETMRIFEALGTDVEITGPVRERIPTPDQLLPPQAQTFAYVSQTKTITTPVATPLVPPLEPAMARTA